MSLETSDFDIPPPSDRLYEIVDGRVVEKSISVYEVHVTNLIDYFLKRFVFERELGFVLSEMLFQFAAQGRRQRRPDVAFISYERWPKQRRFNSDNALQIVPDLAVEVVSPSNSANEVEEKIIEYLEAGVRLIWVVYLTTGRLYAHDGSARIRLFSRTDVLDGGDVLPEFRLDLADIFELAPENV